MAGFEPESFSGRSDYSDDCTTTNAPASGGRSDYSTHCATTNNTLLAGSYFALFHPSL